MKVENGKTYIGVVEDIQDPKKLGRLKIRVMDVFDNTPIQDIPWANPWKDLGGNQFNLPDVGKVVTVVFEDANINNPEYIFSDHYNINLEQKLSELEQKDYNSMKSIFFDHKTQIYVNDSEGLKIDHKFNLLNIKDKSIDINLKDNFSKINLGTSNSTQRSILGDNFLEWFDTLVSALLGNPYIGNSGFPITATPEMMNVLNKYSDLRNPKFLSKNVYIVDNDNVSKLSRINEAQIGDKWQSTIKENNITKLENTNYEPVDGSTSTTFDKPPINTPLGTQSSIINQKPNLETPQDVLILKQILSNKGYYLYNNINKLNIIAVRNQCINSGDKYTDEFVDKLYVFYLTQNGNWEVKNWRFSTVPGLEFTITENWLQEKNLTNYPWSDMVGAKITMKEYIKELYKTNKDPKFKNGLQILAPSQYIDTYYISDYRGTKSMDTFNNATQLIWRDNNNTSLTTFLPDINIEKLKSSDSTSIKIHLGYPGGQKVGNWSEDGSQVFSSEENLNEFFNLCEIHRKMYENKFTYTLVTKKDWDYALDIIESSKNSEIIKSK